VFSIPEFGIARIPGMEQAVSRVWRGSKSANTLTVVSFDLVGVQLVQVGLEGVKYGNATLILTTKEYL
jgi:membrane protein required for beta-lactamase induction